MVDKALEAGMMEDHCTAKEKDTIEAKKGEDKLISAYNVLRIHQFLGKYESDLNHRRSRNAKDKKPRLSKEQREFLSVLEMISSRQFTPERGRGNGLVCAIL